MMPYVLLASFIGLVVGAALALLIKHLAAAALQKSATQVAVDMQAAARQEAENLIKAGEIRAREQVITLRDEFEASTQTRRKELAAQEKELKEREYNLERKLDQVQRRLDEVAARDEALVAADKALRARQAETEALHAKQLQQLETTAGLTRDDARAQLIQKLDDELSNEKGLLIRRHLDEAKQTATRDAQKILVTTMQRFAGECAYDRTTCTVPLPSDEMKGRIIGREGRNIRVFEAITGVNVLIDDTPSAVVIACFEPVRREIARLSLERLVADGRIHPTRVEEVVAKAKADIELEVIKAGEEALQEMQLAHVAPEVATVLGRLRFRYSYTQNVLKHSIEVSHFMGMMAAELGLNVKVARRMGLFHDIGKALDHEIEGSHAIIGMEFLKKFGEDKEVLNGVGCHHDEVPAESALAALVCVADALSASRPGARSETTEMYIKRLEQLEQIGTSFGGVESCYAVQAGREIRVVVEPGAITENEALALSRNIARKIETEMQYPGQIKVCVIRETRSVEYAK